MRVHITSTPVVKIPRLIKSKFGVFYWRLKLADGTCAKKSLYTKNPNEARKLASRLNFLAEHIEQHRRDMATFKDTFKDITER